MSGIAGECAEGLRAARVDCMDPRWLHLIASSPDATASHLPAWVSVVAAAYGFPTFALILEAGDRAVAGLPLVDVSTRLRGRRYACLPFTDHCPPLGSAGVMPVLVQALCDLRADDQLSRIDVRALLPEISSDVFTRIAGLRHQIALPKSTDAALGQMSSRHRRDLRIAERAGLRAEIGTSPAYMAEFARLHSLTRRRLGVPVQPQRFLRGLGMALAEENLGFVGIVWQGERAVASGVFLTSNNVVQFKFSASDADAWHLRPNNLLVWDAMRRSIEQGATLFDFGRSEVGQDGLCAFKRRFGASETPLVYTAIGSDPGPRQLKPGRLSQRLIQRSPSFVGQAVGRALYRYVA